jgi:hypothetical protein
MFDLIFRVIAVEDGSRYVDGKPRTTFAVYDKSANTELKDTVVLPRHDGEVDMLNTEYSVGIYYHGIHKIPSWLKPVEAATNTTQEQEATPPAVPAKEDDGIPF